MAYGNRFEDRVTDVRIFYEALCPHSYDKISQLNRILKEFDDLSLT